MEAPELELTEDAGLEALRLHVVDKALEARAKHGPRLDAAAMRRLVADRSVVRFRADVVFDEGPLRPGEFGWAMPLGERPHDGFALVLHPTLQDRPEDWPLCAAYHLVSINYLDVATSAEAEAFGAALFGLDIDEYYERLCRIADGLPNAIGGSGHHVPGETPPAEEDPRTTDTVGAESAIAAFLAPHLPPEIPSAAGAHGACGCGANPGGSCGSG